MYCTVTNEIEKFPKITLPFRFITNAESTFFCKFTKFVAGEELCTLNRANVRKAKHRKPGKKKL